MMGDFFSRNQKVLMYLLILICWLIVARIESKDWECKDAYHFWKKCETQGDGYCYRGTNPEEGDTTKELLGKIKRAAGANERRVKWRVAFLISVVLFALAFLLVITPGKLPDWPRFYACIAIGMLVLYVASNFGSMHLNYAEKNIKGAVKILQSRTE